MIAFSRPYAEDIVYPDLPQKKLVLGRDYVRLAAGIAKSFDHPSVDEYHAFFFHLDNWVSGQKDSTFGPFLTHEEGKKNRAAVLLMSSNQLDVICVFFQDEVPYGAATITIEPGKQFDSQAIAAAFKPVTPEMVKPVSDKMKFVKSLVSLDDGTQVKSFYISDPDE